LGWGWVTGGSFSWRIDHPDGHTDELEMFSSLRIVVQIGRLQFAARNPAPVPRDEGGEGEGDDGHAGRQADEEEEEKLNLKPFSSTS